MELANSVHPQLREQYNRYRFLFVALCISGILPLLTLLFLYLPGPGQSQFHLSKNILFVFVLFALEVPLCVVLGYLMGFKRMEFLKRSSYVVQRGATSEVKAVGLFKRSGQGNYITCCADIVNDTTGELDRYWIIPDKEIVEAIKELPEQESTSLTVPEASKFKKLKVYSDSASGRIVAVEHGGKIFFVSPPAQLII